MAGDFRYGNVLTAQWQAGASYSNYTTAKTILNAEDVMQIAGNAFQIGAGFRVTAAGALSNIVTTPGTVTFQFMVGTVVAWTSGAIQMTTTANTALPYYLDLILSLRGISVVGTANQAKMLGVGRLSGLGLTVGSGANPTVTDSIINVPVTTPAVGAGFESNATMALDFWAGFSIAAAGNAITNQLYCLERLW